MRRPRGLVSAFLLPTTLTLGGSLRKHRPLTDVELSMLLGDLEMVTWLDAVESLPRDARSLARDVLIECRVYRVHYAERFRAEGIDFADMVLDELQHVGLA